MRSFSVKPEQLDKDVITLIDDKQAEFKKEANRVYSPAKTVNRLLREAYCKKEGEKK